MSKKLLNTASKKEQTELYPRVEALIKILEEKEILTETVVDTKEKEIKLAMLEAGKGKN